MAAFNSFVNRKLYIPECSTTNTRVRKMSQTQISNQIHTQIPRLKTRYESAPESLVQIASEYAIKLNLIPDEAHELSDEEISMILLGIIEGKLMYQLYKEQDDVYIIHSWNSDLYVDYLIVHADIWILGWAWW